MNETFFGSTSTVNCLLVDFKLLKFCMYFYLAPPCCLGSSINDVQAAQKGEVWGTKNKNLWGFSRHIWVDKGREWGKKISNGYIIYECPSSNCSFQLPLAFTFLDQNENI